MNAKNHILYPSVMRVLVNIFLTCSWVYDKYSEEIFNFQMRYIYTFYY